MQVLLSSSNHSVFVSTHIRLIYHIDGPRLVQKIRIRLPVKLAYASKVLLLASELVQFHEKNVPNRNDVLNQYQPITICIKATLYFNHVNNVSIQYVYLLLNVLYLLYGHIGNVLQNSERP